MNYKVIKLIGGKFIWIVTAFLTCCLVVELGWRLFFTKLERDSELESTLAKVKQSLMNNAAAGRANLRHTRNVLAFNKLLSPEEKQKINLCRLTADIDRNFDLRSFLKDRNICVNHHTYLRQQNTIIVEVGGNLGKDSSSFSRNYNSRQIILEPLPKYANILKKKFANNSRITVLNIGLGKKTCTVNVDVRGESTSVFAKPGNTTVKLISSIEFFTKIGVGYFDIDLLTMDCEGCEMGVVETLLENDLMQYINNVQFESHSHLMQLKRDKWVERYCRIQEYLSRSHQLTFQYKHVWENWRRLDLV